ncbi:hypothetical protein KM043_012661 [Ampulex compressa]|nr:hypothetical protein KM043_012661 [Ampulex compressa]
MRLPRRGVAAPPEGGQAPRGGSAGRGVRARVGCVSLTLFTEDPFLADERAGTEAHVKSQLSDEELPATDLTVGPRDPVDSCRALWRRGTCVAKPTAGASNDADADGRSCPCTCALEALALLPETDPRSTLTIGNRSPDLVPPIRPPHLPCQKLDA